MKFGMLGIPNSNGINSGIIQLQNSGILDFTVIIPDFNPDQTGRINFAIILFPVKSVSEWFKISGNSYILLYRYLLQTDRSDETKIVACSQGSAGHNSFLCYYIRLLAFSSERNDKFCRASGRVREVSYGLAMELILYF